MGVVTGKAITRMTIEDAEHISPEQRQAIIDGYPAHEREARVKGIPAMGSGRIYPVPEETIRVDAFETPAHWLYIAGIDFGWDHPTAAVQLAWDRDHDVVYLGAAYSRREATPLEHAATLQSWGDWLPWAWPADAYQRDKRSGGTLRDDYTRHGLNMLHIHAQHPDGGVSVEAGVQRILTRMQTGRFKVFAHLEPWWREFRMYHRKDGLIVKERDDLMDATRYAESMLRFAAEPLVREMADAEEYGQNPVTGY
ncbi:MAG: terminase large subunit domain-containing protein [Mycobacterium sp.]